ncbi:MAG: RNA-binding protein [Ruminococcaceae bacterium]|nr:RNA-binding protein [Oscillospiraceae bacterium]
MINRSNIEKIAHSPEDKLLLAKLWDKIHSGILRNIPSHTPFLSPGEQEMARYLFGNVQGLHFFGGYEDAERKMLVYLPDYLDESCLYEEDSPMVCLRSSFYQLDAPTHRDFLGALMGCGIARESIGDICVGNASCDLFVSAEIATFVLHNLLSAGRAKLTMKTVSLKEAVVPVQEVKQIHDTLASLRLDSVVSSGFRIGRSMASQHICAGKVSIDGLPCEKPDKPVAEGAKISLRGAGKIKLEAVNGQTKKGRISVVIHRYM